MSGLSIIHFIQSFAGPALDVFFVVATMLGSEEFFMITIGAIYWCINKPAGYALGLAVTGSFWLNTLLKDVFQTARPLPAQVRVIYPESASGYAFPSGHTQGAITFWGILGRTFPGRWIRLAGWLIVPAVAVSRLYLGVHWPVDILGGAVIGVIVVVSFPVVLEIGRRWSETAGLGVKLALSVVAPVITVLLDSSLDNAKLAGFASGFGGGAVLEGRLVGFSESARSVTRQLQKFLLGALIVMAVRFGLKSVLPETVFFTYLRYTAVGLAGGLGAPALFVALGLSAEGRSRSR